MLVAGLKPVLQHVQNLQCGSIAMNSSKVRFINVSFLSLPKEYPSDPIYTKSITCRNYTNNSSNALKHAHSSDESLFAVLAVVSCYRMSRLYE
jgi:hypothetical protein